MIIDSIKKFLAYLNAPLVREVRNRFFCHPQAPLIAKQRTTTILLLLFLEGIAIAALFVIIAEGQNVHF